jgi:glycerophosphoryl diester phosphodiesterase
MTVTRGGTEVHEEIKRRNINYIGSEVLFDNDDCEVCSDEYIEKLHNDNLIVWANAIVYNYKDVISSDHTDDVSVLGNPDYGWGWLAKKNFDIIQTDWLTQCDAYLKENGYRR